jgi:hypothetical protein
VEARAQVFAGARYFSVHEKARIADIHAGQKYFAEVELRFSMETIGVKSKKFSTGTGCSANLD